MNADGFKQYIEHIADRRLAVYLNALTSLIEYINKAIKWDKNYILDLWFKRTIKVLQQIKKDEVTIDQDKEIQLDLTKALSKIPGKETEKALITKEIERLFS
jgi:UDP-galactopyranose mutase